MIAPRWLDEGASGHTSFASELPASDLHRRGGRMNRRGVLLGLPGAVAWPLAARAQQPARTPTILWVSTEAQPDPFIAGFRDGMRDRVYVYRPGFSGHKI